KEIPKCTSHSRKKISTNNPYRDEALFSHGPITPSRPGLYPRTGGYARQFTDEWVSVNLVTSTKLHIRLSPEEESRNKNRLCPR
ncbi:MAG: hypothetical protein ACYS0H_16585, partial [Planctomycetota bacterium]